MSTDRRVHLPCLAWMPNADTYCARSKWHAGAHRTAEAMDDRYRSKVGRERPEVPHSRPY